MMMNDRAKAIGRAERALKALDERPRSSRKELGHAREYLNACYSVSYGDSVWKAVTAVETMAARRYGVPRPRRAATHAGPHPHTCRCSESCREAAETDEPHDGNSK